MTTTTEPPQLQALLQPPPQPPLPHRLSTSCDRHPDEHFTGFCPSCLCERLAVLNPNSSAASSSSWKPPSITTSTATAALKAIFKPSSSSSKPPSSSASSFFPELRRTKSFSASKNEGFSGVFEPQRKSCDVRGRNTLWSLFSQDDERNPNPNLNPQRKDPANFRPGPTSEIAEVEPPRISSSSLPRISTSSLPPPVFEEEEEDEETAKSDSDSQNADDDYHNNNVGVDPEVPTLITARNSNARPIEEIVEEEEEEEDQIVIEPEEFQSDRLGVKSARDEAEEEELKPMKDHIDLDTQAKKRDLKEIAGSFWSAASVFSKKLQKWRQKQKLKKQRREELGTGGSSGRLPVEKPIGRQFRETQSEVADYGFGRRSCDTDPRFSLDAGRVSFDDQPRYSFDEPRASWDGYLMAGRLSSSAFTRMPTMVEDYPVNVINSNINGIVNSNCNNNNVVLRSDGQIPVEEDEGVVPGGSAQTREYYSDSSSRRRKSFDRSNSIRKTAAAVVAGIDVAGIDELKSVSNSKVSPAAAAADYSQGMKLVDRDLRDLKDLRDSSSMRDDCSESFEMGYRENGSILGNGERKVGAKKSWRWGRGWSIWGLIHRRSVNKDEDEDRYSRSIGVVERSFSESWQDLRGGSNGDVRGAAFNPKVLRSNSSVSWRNSNGFAGVGSFGGSARKSSVEINGHTRKKRDEFVLERNRSARYSPNNMDNGMLRFYLTPMRGSRRGGLGKGKSNQAHSIARSVLRLY